MIIPHIGANVKSVIPLLDSFPGRLVLINESYTVEIDDALHVLTRVIGKIRQRPLMRIKNEKSLFPIFDHLPLLDKKPAENAVDVNLHLGTRLQIVIRF